MTRLEHARQRRQQRLVQAEVRDLLAEARRSIDDALVGDPNAIYGAHWAVSRAAHLVLSNRLVDLAA